MDVLMKKAAKGAVRYGTKAAKMTPLGVIATTVQHKIVEKREKKDKEQVEEYVVESGREVEEHVEHNTGEKHCTRQAGNTQHYHDETDWEEDSSDEEEGEGTAEKRKKKKKRNNTHQTTTESDPVEETSNGVSIKSQILNNPMSFLDSKKLKELLPKDIKKHIPKNIKECGSPKKLAGERSSTPTTPTTAASGSPNKKNGKSMTSRATEFISSEKSKKMGKNLWKKKDAVMEIAQRFMK